MKAADWVLWWVGEKAAQRGGLTVASMVATMVYMRAEKSAPQRVRWMAALTDAPMVGPWDGLTAGMKGTESAEM